MRPSVTPPTRAIMRRSYAGSKGTLRKTELARSSARGAIFIFSSLLAARSRGLGCVACDDLANLLQIARRDPDRLEDAFRGERGNDVTLALAGRATAGSGA